VGAALQIPSVFLFHKKPTLRGQDNIDDALPGPIGSDSYTQHVSTCLNSGTAHGGISGPYAAGYTPPAAKNVINIEGLEQWIPGATQDDPEQTRQTSSRTSRTKINK